MLKIDKISDHYTWQAEVKIPNNGQFDKFTVKIKLKRLPHDERMQLLSRITELANDDTAESEKLLAFERYQDELLDKVFLGWEKGQIVTEDGQLDDDTDGIALMLKMTEFRQAVMQAYQQSNGGEKVKEGNSAN